MGRWLCVKERYYFKQIGNLSVHLRLLKKLTFFIIQLIFVNIYRSYYIFLILFIDLTVIFQILFNFIYSTFNKKFLISVK